MERRISTHEYLRMPETNRPAELVHGVVREPPAPRYGHQKTVGQLFYLLKVHVEKHTLGDVCVSPIDVVLDEAAALVVQPDVIFVSKQRSSIIQDYIVGAPDIVVEVLSPGTNIATALSSSLGIDSMAFGSAGSPIRIRAQST